MSKQKLVASTFNCESRLSMLAIKVLLRKLDLIELGGGSSSPSKAEVYSYGFIENCFRY